MGYNIQKIKKAVNHKYDVREVYSIDTNEWFSSLEFSSIKSLQNFLKKEGKL